MERFDFLGQPHQKQQIFQRLPQLQQFGQPLATVVGPNDTPQYLPAGHPELGSQGVLVIAGKTGHGLLEIDRQVQALLINREMFIAGHA